MASSSRLKPGEKGKIRVSVNVQGKSGVVFKSIRVYTNDPNINVTSLTVTMIVKDKLHIKKHEAKAIFFGECKNCHVDRGTGKTGIELFISDCIMCHESGKSAMSIKEMQNKPKEYLIRSIEDGVIKTSMPGWHIKNNGPLTAEEIRSLVSAIKQN